MIEERIDDGVIDGDDEDSKIAEVKVQVGSKRRQKPKKKVKRHVRRPSQLTFLIFFFFPGSALQLRGLGSLEVMQCFLRLVDPELQLTQTVCIASFSIFTTTFTGHPLVDDTMHPTPVLHAQVVEASLSDAPAPPHPAAAPEAEAHVTPSTSSTVSAQDVASTRPPYDGREQYLLVLSGLIGSGKSTFARALVKHFPDWRRCNQDELGDRHAVVFAARNALLAGYNVIIDRTNIDAKQRRTWLELARELQEGEEKRKIVTVSLTLTISIEAAEERLKVRVGHETIKDAEQALGILPHFLRTYQKASVEEGFHYVLTFPAAKMGMEPSKEEVNEILFARLETEERGQEEALLACGQAHAEGLPQAMVVRCDQKDLQLDRQSLLYNINGMCQSDCSPDCLDLCWARRDGRPSADTDFK